jgi:hypothetical protein
MKMALENTDLSEVDVVVMHALNDKRYYRIKQLKSFGTSPLLTTNKWKIGHTWCLDFEYGTCYLNDATQYVYWSSFAEAQNKRNH